MTTTSSASYQTGNQAVVREMNLSVIMHQLRDRSPISRAELASVTGLNKTTVSSLVQELTDHHFVREVGLNVAKAGRPAMLLELNPKAGHIVSAEIGVDFISVVCTNFASEITWRQDVKTHLGDEQIYILKQTFTLISQAIEYGKTLIGPLLGIALATPGLVNQTEGRLIFAPNLGWTDVPLKEMLQENFGDIPIFIDNEANLAALGEYYFGSAQGFQDIIYIGTDIGLGGAIIQGGELLRGVTGTAGELGHITMDPDGPLCNCGNRGCWETQASRVALFRFIQEAISTGAESTLGEKDELTSLTLPVIVSAAQAGDQVAQSALQKIGSNLGIGMASLVNIFNPELVIVGGVMTIASEFIFPTLKAELDARAFTSNLNSAQIILARPSFPASLMGGMGTVYQMILSHPTAVIR